MPHNEELKKHLRSIAEKSAGSAGLELYHLEFQEADHNSVLRVFVESPPGTGAGIGLEECEKVSRRLSAELEIEDIIPGRYVLEVSSPGIERILATPEHFQRAFGRLAVVRTAVAIDGARKHQGRISAFQDGVLDLVRPEGSTMRIPFGQISSAHVAFEDGASAG